MRHLALALALSACAGLTDEAPADSDADAGRSTWFVGTATFRAPSGTELGEAPAALARTLDPDAGVIVDRVLEATADGPPFDEAITYAVDVEAGTFTGAFHDGYGTFEVEGSFTAGEPWDWTAWTVRQTYADGPYVGSYLTSDERVTGARLVQKKSVYSPDDHHEMDMVVRLDVVDEAAFDAAVKAIRD